MKSRLPYQQFLSLFGLGTSDVPPLMPGASLEAARKIWRDLRHQINLEDRAKLEQWLSALDSDSNAVIRMIETSFEDRLCKHKMVLPIPYCTGIFPTCSFNAQARLFDDSALILLDMGCMQLIEAITLAWAWQTEDLDNNRKVCQVVARYVLKYAVPDQKEVDHPSLHDGVRMLAYSQLITKAEEFVIGHEIAHIFLGHVTAASSCHAFPTPLGTVSFVSKAWEEEFAADALAFKLLIPDTITRVAAQQLSAGPGIVLGVAALIEQAFKLFKPVERANNDSHPPAFERYKRIQSAYQRIGIDQNADMGRKFFVFVNDCVQLMSLEFDNLRRTI